MLWRRLIRTSLFASPLSSKLSPVKLIALQFAWVIPYFFLTNYLERSLLPFRLLCYTQSNFLSVNTPLREDFKSCVKSFFPDREPNAECRLNRRVEAIMEPRIVEEWHERIVVIRSAPNSVDYRNYMRASWAPTLLPEVATVFVTGSGNDEQLRKEHDEFGDILQLDFVDSYFNLTLKMMAIYGYIIREKPHIQDIIVINDDTIVNGTALHQIPTSKGASYMLGKVSRGYPRLIMWWLPWYVPGTMYPNMCYPPFIQGSSFIISRSAAQRVLDGICDVPAIHLDDVMMGVVANCLRLELRHNEGFDHHTLDKFVVFHYQYSRFSAAEMLARWRRSGLDVGQRDPTLR
uniref:Hexosyltransferase n=1 Tax=Steinernema glaseri TaxID=37863 RepID=A0A1I8A1F2_9BILA